MAVMIVLFMTLTLHRAQFKNGKPFETPLPIHRQSCYLFGRERRIADVPTDHPSCSKQQAVIQFRCRASNVPAVDLLGPESCIEVSFSMSRNSAQSFSRLQCSAGSMLIQSQEQLTQWMHHVLISTRNMCVTVRLLRAGSSG